MKIFRFIEFKTFLVTEIMIGKENNINVLYFYFLAFVYLDLEFGFTHLQCG